MRKSIIIIFAVALCLSATPTKVLASGRQLSEALPDFEHPKVQQDIAWATEHGVDPYMVLAHIRIESGAHSIYAGASRKKDDKDHTRAKSHTGDYGRHQINCFWWKKHQKNWRKKMANFQDFPKEAQIKKCSDLYKDEVNRHAYYYLLKRMKKHFNRGKGKRIVHGIPQWWGHYQTGFAPPRSIYLKKLGRYYKYYKKWKKYRPTIKRTEKSEAYQLFYLGIRQTLDESK